MKPVAIFVIVSCALFVLGVEHKHEEYIPPRCITGVRFMKTCKEMGGSHARCDGVIVDFQCVAFGPHSEPMGAIARQAFDAVPVPADMLRAEK